MIPQTQTPHPVVPPSWLHVCDSFRWLHRTIYKRTPFLMKSNSANRPKPTAEGSVDFRDGPFQIGRPPPKYLNTDTRTRTARVGSCNNRWLWGTLWPPRIRRYHHPWERDARWWFTAQHTDGPSAEGLRIGVIASRSATDESIFAPSRVQKDW